MHTLTELYLHTSDIHVHCNSNLHVYMYTVHVISDYM